MTPEQLLSELKKMTKLRMYNDRTDPLFEKSLMIRNYLCSRQGRGSPRQAMDQIQSLGNIKVPLSTSLLESWAGANPEAAAAYYAENRILLPPHIEKILAREMGKASPEQAWKWLNTLSGRSRESAPPTS